MKVTLLQGSPRPKGNTAVLAEKFAAGMRDAGAEVEIINLWEKTIQPCDACDRCGHEPGEFCVHDDDMKGLMNTIKNSDALVAATPVWWTGMTCNMKIFLDRLYGYRTKEFLCGKDLYLITTYFDVQKGAKPTPGADIAAYAFQSLADFLGMEFIGRCHLAPATGEAANDPEALARIYEEGKHFAALLTANAV